MSEHDVNRQTEFAVKLVAIQQESCEQLTPLGWFLLTAAICSMGEPTVTVFPKLSHSASKIKALGVTYIESFNKLPQSEQEAIQYFYRRFVDSLSYGQPTLSDLRD